MCSEVSEGHQHVRRPPRTGSESLALAYKLLTTLPLLDCGKMDLSERSNRRRSRAPKGTLETVRTCRGKKGWPRLARKQNKTGATRLDNTRKLVMAALRLWEWKQGIHE